MKSNSAPVEIGDGVNRKLLHERVAGADRSRGLHHEFDAGVVHAVDAVNGSLRQETVLESLSVVQQCAVQIKRQ